MGKRNFFIILLIFLALSLTLGCTQQGKAPATTTLEVVCNLPYLRVGQDCCLDINNNSICDTDEKVETTMLSTVVSTIGTTIQQTTSVSTTSVSTTSTSTIKYVCSTNADCGGPQYGNTFCDGSSVMRQVTTYRCSKPNTSDAKCIGSVGSEKVITCEEPNRCVGGKCVTETGVPVATTSLGCSWTQQSCLDYCQDSCSDRGMSVQKCEYDGVACRCTATCGSTVTTTPGSTSTLPATTTTSRSTTTSIRTTTTISVQCGGDLYNSNTCNGACNSNCEDCVVHPQYSPCYYCKDKDCATLGGALVLKNYTECTKYCNDPDVGYCKKWDTCDHCYYCYEYQCGNDIVEPGEECESDFDCEDISIYLYCGMDCLCYPDCDAYCDAQGVNGYQWINNGAAGPVIATQQQCTNWAQQKLQQLSQQTCKTHCVASAFYDYQGETCCCVNWNSLPCQNCPGNPPICPSTDDCMDTL